MIESIIGSIIATLIIGIVLWWYRKKSSKAKQLKNLKKTQIEIGKRFLEQGLTKFHFSRDDYDNTLASFLESASQCITIVSISLKVKDDEGRLTELFKRKLSANPIFNIAISLINPENYELLKIVANTLNISNEKLYREITEMLEGLLKCYNSLNDSEKSRFKILVHDCFPIGSAIIIDASPKGGMIQVETKLYKAPRSASFGYQLTNESPFYKNNFIAWQRIIEDSKSYSKIRIKKHEKS